MKTIKTDIKMNIIILVNIAVFLLFGGSFDLFSNPVEMKTAKKVAQNYMGKSRQTSKTVSDVVTERFEGQNSFYVVNFREGGWVMVSADDSTVPVFAYSNNGTYRIEDEKPGGFLFLVEEYKEQVDIVRKSGSTRSAEIAELWNQLMDDGDNNAIGRANIIYPDYNPGVIILDVPGRGEVAWGQDINNSGGCGPSFNMHSPIGPFGLLARCECRDLDGNILPPAGCGAVAMAQVMWYWQWPKSSTYRTYNWDLMPNLLSNGQWTEGNEIAHLIRDCGLAVNMGYACLGSFTYPHLIESALKNDFDFKSARLEIPADWGGAWHSLIRSEIDCGRPVIYKGERGLWNPEKHFFVIDGYEGLFFPYFHINFGWRGAWNGHFYLWDITPGNHNFNRRHEAIIGISPTYNSPSSVNVTDLTDIQTALLALGVPLTIEAQQNISLPASGKSLVVESGSSLTLVAGNSITLGNGFHAKAGSQFSTKIEPIYAVNMEITVPNWPNVINDNTTFSLPVNNANSYDFIVKTFLGNKIVYQNAGITFLGEALLWLDAPPPGIYNCTVRLRNNFGRTLEHTWVVIVLSSRSSGMDNNSTNIDHREFSPTVNNNVESHFIMEDDIVVYPNPTNGTVYIVITKSFANYNLKIYSITGALAYEGRNITQPSYSFEMSIFVDGIYIFQLEIDNQIVSKTIILAR